MRKTEQQDILLQKAQDHGLTIGQAEEVWMLFCRLIKETISKEDKKENGLYVVDNFKIIHIDNFGKFKIKKKTIVYANNAITRKNNERST